MLRSDVGTGYPSLMALYEMIECGQCGHRNRVLPETGTKGIRCGRCRGDLPTRGGVPWLRSDLASEH
jgi:hypothetical protein